MKPTSYMENFYIEKLREQERPKPIAWDLLVLWLCYLLVIAFLSMAGYSALGEEANDGTETGASCTTDTDCGCTDDCLEPAIEDEAQTVRSQGRVEL